MKAKHIVAISPSGIHDPQKVQDSIALLESWGHRVTLAPNYAAKHMYTAGTFSQRIADVRWALAQDDADIIWFVRGGYGTAQLLPLIKQCDKTVVGFSDATALLAHMWNKREGQAMHGPVLNSLSSLCDAQSIQHVKTWLETGNLPTMPAEYFCGPTDLISGRLVGGNLCVLAHLCGTPFQLQTDNCILALEDISEPPYKIDRMLLQLEQSGMFDNIQAIVLGDFHNCNPPTDAVWTLEDVWQERLSYLGVPVYHRAPFGHAEVNWLWKMGQTIELGQQSATIIP
jgi:muramoyltetrapeptide carboxypeptidase